MVTALHRREAPLEKGTIQHSRGHPMKKSNIRQHSQNNKHFSPPDNWEQFPKEKTWLLLKQAAFSVANALDLSPANAVRANNMRACATHLVFTERVDSETGEVRRYYHSRGWACNNQQSDPPPKAVPVGRKKRGQNLAPVDTICRGIDFSMKWGRVPRISRIRFIDSSALAGCFLP